MFCDLLECFNLVWLELVVLDHKQKSVKIAIKLYSPPSPPPPPLGGQHLARPQTIRPTPNMLENGLTQFMQFRQQQQQAAAAAAAQADLFARLGRPLPRLPLPLPLPFLHAHMAAQASAKFGPGAATSPFADNLRARFHGFAAAAQAAQAQTNSVGQNSTSPPMLQLPPPPGMPGALSLHPPASLLPRTSPNSSSNQSENPLMTSMGQTSPSCRNPYNDDMPMSPNGKNWVINFRV